MVIFETMSHTQELQTDIKRLHNQGVNLVNALQVAIFPAELEAHFTNVLKKDFQDFKKSLPVFATTYQAWYSEAQVIIKRFLPLRLNDFIALYEPQRTRKEIRQDNYTIEDYLKNVVVTTGFDKKVVAGPADAIPLMQQQLNILDSVSVRLESAIFEMTEILQSELLDRLLGSAKELEKQGLARSAGAVCATILEQHLHGLKNKYQLRIPKKNPGLREVNEALYQAEVYDHGIARQISFLCELRDLCIRNKKTAPSAEQVEQMLSGTEKVIKTVF